jgi:probable rRNA maturation factor
MVLVQVEARRARWAGRVVRRDAQAFLSALGLSRAELSVVLCEDPRIRETNRAHRGKDRATDVLSFPMALSGRGKVALGPPLARLGRSVPAPPVLGDIMISITTARRQAKERGHPLSVELARLLAHGLLHLLGYDHERPADARRMAAAEDRLLGRAGLVRDSGA